MDPETAWRVFLDACQQQDWSGAQETAVDILAWLDRGVSPRRANRIALWMTRESSHRPGGLPAVLNRPEAS